MIKTYIGTKFVTAKPVTAKEAEVILNRPVDVVNADKEGNGYLVRYKDGYLSWSPKQQFEEAYKLIDVMDFGSALICLKNGYKVARKGWNGVGIFIALQCPDEDSKMSSPYIYIDTTGLQTDNPNAPKSRVPWLASQTDMLAEDWIIVLG